MSDLYDAAAEVRGAIHALNETMQEICNELAKMNLAIQHLLDHKASILVTEDPKR